MDDESVGPLDLFRKTWKKLARRSKCDGWDGMECRRVLKEYLAADCPTDVEQFIVERANDGPWNWSM